MSVDKTPILFPYDPDDFWKKIKEVIHNEVQKINLTKTDEVVYEVPGLKQKPLYKAHEVCAMFQITRQTLHQWQKEGILKPYKIKSRVFFLWADLEALIAKNT